MFPLVLCGFIEPISSVEHHVRSSRFRQVAQNDVCWAGFEIFSVSLAFTNLIVPAEGRRLKFLK